MMRSKFILIVTFLGLLESSGLWGEVALLDEVTLVVEVGVLDEVVIVQSACRRGSTILPVIFAEIG